VRFWNQRQVCLLGMILLSLPASASDKLTGFPFTDETLRYSVNWPGGLSLGEGQFRATREGEVWKFQFTLSAEIPVYSAREDHRATATSELCSLELNKESLRGKRKTSETTRFDRESGVATRTTSGGGKSEFAIPVCARDALTFLYLTRRELGQGRVPPPERIYFGAAYDLRLEYKGERTVMVAGRSTVTDLVAVTLKGPKSAWTFDMFFARDAARTPLVIRVPFAIGSFSLELVR
jgi:hypothetical protein